MPLSRAINYTHPAASNFFQNLIIPEKPIAVLTVDVAEQIIQRWLDRRMLAVTVQCPRKEDTSNKGRAPRAMWTHILRRCPIHSGDAERQNRRANSCRVHEHRSSVQLLPTQIHRFTGKVIHTGFCVAGGGQSRQIQRLGIRRGFECCVDEHSFAVSLLSENRAPEFGGNFGRLIRPGTADIAPAFPCRDLFRSA